MDLFADEPEADASIGSNTNPAWPILLVDDDEQVHAVTRLALRNFEFLGRPIELLSAHSKNQALEIFHQRQDIALALVDVVMETDHAGLELVEQLRGQFHNLRTRLVLRTGQPGQAPEDSVIRDYDIDGYFEKTELTAQKLRSLLYTSLRSYRDILIIEGQRDGIKKVMQATNQVQSVSSFKEFASAVLTQLTSLLSLGESALYCLVQSNDGHGHCKLHTLAATGSLDLAVDEHGMDLLPPLVAERFQTAIASKKSFHYPDAYVSYLQGAAETDNLLYVTHNYNLPMHDQQLLEVFTQNVTLTFENISLIEDVRETQKELVYLLADAVEARSKETGAHVQRVALACEMLARLYGLSAKDTEMIKLAAPLHDIGKVAIPDAILHKPGKLSAVEWQLMQRHVDFGVDILQKSKRPLMRMGAVIAGHHHERWDGGGYPQGLAGEDIPIAGRISALADVFDALGSKRCYKEPWTAESIKQLIVEERGRHFDPQLVDILLANFDQFWALRAQYPDQSTEPKP